MTGLAAKGRTIRVLVVDDHPAVRAGIAGLIEAEDDMTVVAQADDGRAAIEAYRLHQPDVTLMDLQMSGLDGLAAIAEIRAQWPIARIVVLTTYSGDMQAVRALEAGAWGYLLKTTIRSNMLKAIRATHAGQAFTTRTFAVTNRTHPKEQELSPPEINVLRLVANSGRNKLVAAEMGFPEETMDVHMKSILAKLEAIDRVQAVAIALRRGIIDTDL